MRQSREERLAYFIGILFSAVVHLVCAVGAVILFEHRAATASFAPQVFTVTLEGGEKLGGISQVPEPGHEKDKPAVDLQEAPPTPEEPGDGADQVQSEPETEPETEVSVKEIEKPSIVEDRERELREKRELEEKKRKAQEKKKAAEAKKRKALEEKKRKAAEEKRKAEAERKRKKEQRARQAAERKARDRRLAEISRSLKDRYRGESANAGGTGFGAARLGGKGMGGGVLASAEYIAYSNALQEHVKSGWRWLSGTSRLKARVRVQILPSGMIQDVRIEQSSGNPNFDDSVVRAVRKASPVPPPPPKYAADFRDVRFTFDSHEN